MARRGWPNLDARRLALASIALLAVVVPLRAADFRAQVEADWLTQSTLRVQPASLSAGTTAEDARGAIDGVKNGLWGFHTSQEDQPWWQVDLGAAQPLDRVVLYNRNDGCGPRANRIKVLLGDDGKTWRLAYQHDGTNFGGYPDNKPLVVKLNGAAGPRQNLALEGAPEQSSLSQWSKKHPKGAAVGLTLEEVVSRGLRLADDLGQSGVDTRAARARLERLRDQAAQLAPDAAEPRKQLFVAAHWAIRELALANPLLDFDRIVFAKQAPGTFSHMSDQYYGWWSRPGGGLYVLEGFRTGEPRVRCLTEGRPAGSYLRPDLSCDGRRVLFAYCVYHEGLAGDPNKLDKAHLAEDAFYHLFELDLGSGA
ncbi:MAG: discoidin domain-containing protein, partial [Armatimonadetes bacterium]|nr:discoidin domain-containing protein [Armatimonadota bacterium]